MKSEINNWKTTNSNLAFETPWIKVTKHNVINPSGKPGIYGVVSFKNLAIGVLPIDEEYNTWLVGQWRYPLNTYSWEIPEGGGPLNDDPLISAKRELKEETGIVAGKYRELTRMHTSNSATDELAIIYIAQDLTFTNPEPEENEDLQVKKVPFNTVFEMVMNGEITDSLTMIAVLKTKILINEGKL
jgi:8-oxo-dGTP pyrophosphatase MutT (NUDIX family)